MTEQRVLPTRASRGPPVRFSPPARAKGQRISVDELDAIAPSPKKPRDLFCTEESVVALPDQKLGAPAILQFEKILGEKVFPMKPAANVCCFGPHQGGGGAMHDEDGRFYRPGGMVWASVTEQTTTGLQADTQRLARINERHRKEDAARRNPIKKKRAAPKELGVRRRHGNTYYALFDVVDILIKSAEGGSRQAPTVLGQETVNLPFMMEAQMIKSPVELPEEARQLDGWWHARNYVTQLNGSAIDGHAVAELKDCDNPSAEGATLLGALDLGEYLKVVGCEQHRPGALVQPLDAVMLAARRTQPAVRAPFATEAVFPPIPPGVVGWSPTAGPLWTGASDSLGWAKLVFTGGDAPQVSTTTNYYY